MPFANHQPWPLPVPAAHPQQQSLSLSAATKPLPSIAELRLASPFIFPQQLDRKLPRPFSGRRLVSSAVGLVDVSNLRNEGVIGVGVGEHGADRQEHCSYISKDIPWGIWGFLGAYLSISSELDSTGLEEYPNRCCRLS